MIVESRCSVEIVFEPKATPSPVSSFVGLHASGSSAGKTVSLGKASVARLESPTAGSPAK